MTIRERINFLEALEEVINLIDGRIRSELVWRTDDEGDYLRNDDGDIIAFEPDPVKEKYSYDKWQAYKRIKAEVEKLANK